LVSLIRTSFACGPGGAALPPEKMITIKWLIRMLADIVWFGIANRAIGMSLAVISLLFLGVVIVAVKVTAPFIYTLF